MFTVFSKDNTSSYELGDLYLTREDWSTLQLSAVSELRSKDQDDAADILLAYSFELRQGGNFLKDEFVVLYAQLSMDSFREAMEKFPDHESRFEFRQIAQTLANVCDLPILFITFDHLPSDGVAPIEEPQLEITNRTVEQALTDARQLIKEQGSTSGVDRAHTALHGYLGNLCNEAGIVVQESDDITRLFKLLRTQHPKLLASGARKSDITQILRTLSAVVNVLNPLRNQASLAHPNPSLLDEPEADLVLCSIQTLLRYLDLKLR